jgi:hypothetical protein
VYFENDPFLYILQAVAGNFELNEDGVSLEEFNSTFV